LYKDKHQQQYQLRLQQSRRLGHSSSARKWRLVLPQAATQFQLLAAATHAQHPAVLLRQQAMTLLLLQVLRMLLGTAALMKLALVLLLGAAMMTAAAVRVQSKAWA
jgi:hypothetical protein